MAVLGEDDVGIFVALSGFTRDAEQEARQTHRRLTLIDMAWGAFATATASVIAVLATRLIVR